jgi:cytochrome b6-f complex iron-sulfur subunit
MKKTILLAVGLVFILGVILIPQFYSRAQESVFKVGRIADFPIGTIQLVTHAKVLVIRDSEGIYAISAVCTHLGCLVREKKGALACPCHGAQFNLSGKVLQGPARDDLAWYGVKMDKMGNLTVDTTQAVASGTKLAIPK